MCLKLVCDVNIVYGNLKSENSQDYAQKPQRNCTFMNLASVQPERGKGHPKALLRSMPSMRDFSDEGPLSINVYSNAGENAEIQSL